MAKNSIRDYSATNSSNTDIQSIDISEGCSPAGINNAIREVMADLKDVSTGAVALESPAFDSASLTGDLTFGDSDKAIFGAGSDLQIYHDGSHSYIDEQGTGNLRLRGSNFVQILDAAGNDMIQAEAGGAVDIYHNGSAKFATTATGAQINGQLNLENADGDIVTGVKATKFGYSSTYRVTQVGDTSGNNSVSIAYDPSTNTSGSFDGTGHEVLFRNGVEFMTPNSANTGFHNDVIRMQDGNVKIGEANTDVTSKLTVSGKGSADTATFMYDGNTGTYFDINTNAANGTVNLEANARSGGFPPLTFTTGGSERLRINSDGAVVINNTGGDAQLYLGGTSGTSRMYLARTGLDAFLWNVSNGNLRFGTNNAERMRIDSNGRLLLGRTSTVGYKLDVLGDVKFERTGTSATHVVFTNANGNVGSISTSGTSTSYNTSSDYRLKENVVADWDATTRLKQLNPVRFNFIADADTTVDGFLAHEVQGIVPEAISGTKDAMRDEEYQVSAATGDVYTPAIEAVLDEDGNEVTPAVAEVIHSTDVEQPEELAEGQQWRETTAAVMGTRSVPNYQGIDQSKLTPLLTKALIEAVETIEALEARITALEAN